MGFGGKPFRVFFRASLALLGRFFGASLALLWRFLGVSWALLWRFFGASLGASLALLWRFFGASLLHHCVVTACFTLRAACRCAIFLAWARRLLQAASFLARAHAAPLDSACHAARLVLFGIVPRSCEHRNRARWRDLIPTRAYAFVLGPRSVLPAQPRQRHPAWTRAGTAAVAMVSWWLCASLAITSREKQFIHKMLHIGLFRDGVHASR